MEPMTQQNSPKRQGSKMKQQSLNRDTLATHSQRANEFSPTNPSYYITFNQDSHIDHHKFNPVPNLIGTTGDLIGSGPSISRPSLHLNNPTTSSSSGKTSSETRQGGRTRQIGGGAPPSRSESKNSSRERTNVVKNNGVPLKTRPNIRRVEVPTVPSNVTPLGGEGVNEEGNQEIIIKSANIIGINRKIKVNRIVNRNQIPLAPTATTPSDPSGQIQGGPNSDKPVLE